MNASANEVHVGPNPGPQTDYVRSSADITIFGGSAGPGKSWGTLFRMGVHADRYPGYYGVIFRRESTEITGGGGLWEESLKLFPMFGAVARAGNILDWRWPNRSMLEFRHMNHAGDEIKHHGKQYAECAALGTPVLMADGSWRAIEAVATGDVVQTLEGPRAVTRSRSTGRKSVVRITTPYGEALVSDGHQLLCGQTWASPISQLPKSDHVARGIVGSTLCSRREAPPRAESPLPDRLQERPREAATRRSRDAPPFALMGCPSGAQFSPLPNRYSELSGTLGASPVTSPEGPRPPGIPSSNPRHTLVPWQPLQAETQPPEISAFPGDDQSGCGASGDSHQVPWQPLRWSFQATLFAPDPVLEAASATLQEHAGVDAHRDPLAQGSLADCRFSPRSCGVPPRTNPARDQASSPSQVDAAAPDARTRTGDCETSRQHTPACSGKYLHPYTMEERPVFAGVRPCLVEAVQAGEAETWDLTVDGASHYVTSGGLVSKNCGFDELTTFLESQFWYMLSRLRSNCGLRPKVVATCNPDPDSWVRAFVDWWIGEDGLARDDRAGVKRYFLRSGNELIWGNSPDEVRALAPFVDMKPMSLRFIPARLSDNPKVDPTYADRLKAMPLVERERLLGGNWNVRHAAGNVFKREWFEIIDSVPGDILKKGRYWDLAATEPSADNKDPDWTRGVKMSRHKSGLFVIHDVVSLRGRAHAVDALVQATAQQDGHECAQGFWQDPGQAGKSEAERYRRELAGYTVRIERASSDKITYAKPSSSQAEGGNIKLVRAPWNEAYLAEHEGFPDARHDDIVDAESLGMRDLTTGIQDRGPAISIASTRGSGRGW